MPGASQQTREVKVLNANWTAGPDDTDGHFELMLVTDDDQHHTILLWDPTNHTLIGANVVGTWLTHTAVTRADAEDSRRGA